MIYLIFKSFLLYSIIHIFHSNVAYARRPRRVYKEKIQYIDMYTKEIYEQAFVLRKKGFSIRRVARHLKIPAYSTIRDWTILGKTPRGKFLNSEFKKITPGLGYILGVVEGDGYITLRRTKGNIGLEVNDRDFALCFKDKLEKWSGLKVKFKITEGQNTRFIVTLHSLSQVR